MARKRYSPEEIIGKLRSAEVWLAEGVTVAEVVRRLGVQRVTYYRWRKEYGGSANGIIIGALVPIARLRPPRRRTASFSSR